MNRDDLNGRQRHRGGAGKSAPVTKHTTKGFQLEVLDKLGEMNRLSESLDESWSKKLEAVRDQRTLKFDSRTLIAVGAIALSVTGYVIQEAGSSARQASEIESTKARVMSLEQLATTNTESRVRTEIQLGELRDGMAEIKALLQSNDVAGKKFAARK